MKYTYLLIDDNGVSNSENEILLPVGATFRHEFGEYRVDEHRNDLGEIESNLTLVTQIGCERIGK